MNSKLSQKLEQEVMSHFCYDYAKCLYDKLLELREKKKFLIDDRVVCPSITHSVIESLSGQINFNIRVNDEVEFDLFMNIAKEYLAIFEDEPTKKLTVT